MPIAKHFWDGARWNGHAAFNTISHTHVSCYFPADGYDSCDIMAVECADGRWYVEDNWGGDANGADGVWNPFDKSDADPRFFASEEAAIRHAVAVVATVSGVSQSDLLKNYLE
jgi:hypothetical protein